MKASVTVSIALSTTLLAAPSFASNLTEGVPTFDHQIVIMMENHAYDQVIGNTINAPYINNLANTYNLATNYFATTHPSLPNYLDIISGSNFGNGSPYDLKGHLPNPNLGNDNAPAASIGTIGAPSAATANCVPGSL